jgi:rhodanese-related sulfurtransferase/rubrerythrin
MRWRQFFTPVDSMNADQAKKYMADHNPSDFTVLDVRQPGEYQAGHIPGAKLIPVTDVSERIGEIDSQKPVIVYCAMGGRSRVAAQMLSGKGFDQVYNLNGGFKAWKGKSAYGGQERGLNLFSGKESPEEALVVAYSLEAGLEDFYLKAIPKVNYAEAKSLFEKLAKIEVKHQERIFDQYLILTGKSVSKKDFEKNILKGVVEGGLTTEEYTAMFNPDWNLMTDIVDLAMSIEAQAYDLYMRAAERTSESGAKEALLKIADEERSHMTQLGKLLEG